MIDIVEKLRTGNVFNTISSPRLVYAWEGEVEGLRAAMREAADEIERLRTKVVTGDRETLYARATDAIIARHVADARAKHGPLLGTDDSHLVAEHESYRPYARRDAEAVIDAIREGLN